MTHARLALGSAVASALVLAGCSGGGGASAPKNAPIGGSYIVAICDVDMDATSFVTNRLVDRGSAATDQLTTLQLPIREPSTPYAQIPVSNSVFGPPAALAISQDSRFAFIVESRGPAPEGASLMQQIPPGTKLSAIDLANPLEPIAMDITRVSTSPSSVDVHPDGDLVLVARRTKDRQQLVVVPFDANAGFGAPIAWPMFGLDDDAASPSCAMWHPSGRFIGVTLPDRNQVMFYEFSQASDGLSLSPWGDPVRVGKYPYSGQFTPDGRHFITTDMHWGPDVEGFIVGAPEGGLSVIAFDNGAALTETAPWPTHRVVSSAKVGISPEALAISPDGRLVATANLHRSFMPIGDPRLTPGGSLTLLRFNPETGSIEVRDRAELDGMPECIVFDNDARHLGVILFRTFDRRGSDGEIAFWKVQNEQLVEPEVFVGAGMGGHALRILP